MVDGGVCNARGDAVRPSADLFAVDGPSQSLPSPPGQGVGPFTA